jgi:hypothetical protein
MGRRGRRTALAALVMATTVPLTMPMTESIRPPMMTIPMMRCSLTLGWNISMEPVPPCPPCPLVRCWRGLAGVVSVGALLLRDEGADGADDAEHGAGDDADNGVDQAADNNDSHDEVPLYLGGNNRVEHLWVVRLAWCHRCGRLPLGQGHEINGWVEWGGYGVVGRRQA